MNESRRPREEEGGGEQGAREGALLLVASKVTCELVKLVFNEHTTG
jgi:hypothetical protein